MSSIVRSSFLAAALLGAPVFVTPAAAQVPEVPAPSPKARVEQRVGVTDFSVEYSSPGVKGRPVFGTVVAWDQPWRTGANAATKLTASRDFTFGGKAIPAGSYSLFTVPGQKEWAVLLNSNVNMSGTAYDAKTEVARVSVKPAALPAARERLTFLFENTTDDATQLTLEWEKVRVATPIAVDTKAHVAANIDKSMADAWRPPFVAARYVLDTNGDVEKGLGFVNQSIAVTPTWWNHLVKAQLLGKKGQKKDAIATAEKAAALGKGDGAYESYGKDMVSKALAELKK